MRMPILSYFLVAGSALFCILTVASTQIDQNISAVHVSQMVGLPAPFKAPPEESPSGIGD
jgi:hypothetical protein